MSAYSSGEYKSKGMQSRMKKEHYVIENVERRGKVITFLHICFKLE